jgi:DNA-directed RNA polymerase specialized sigma24 family protein
MYLLALPLTATFSRDVAESILEAIQEQVRKALDERERRDLSNEWLTPAQMAERLGISPEAVRKRAVRGRIESRHHGRRLLVRLGDG